MRKCCKIFKIYQLNHIRMFSHLILIFSSIYRLKQKLVVFFYLSANNSTLKVVLIYEYSQRKERRVREQQRPDSALLIYTLKLDINQFLWFEPRAHPSRSIATGFENKVSNYFAQAASRKSAFGATFVSLEYEVQINMNNFQVPK